MGEKYTEWGNYNLLGKPSWVNWLSIHKRITLDPPPTLYTKFNPDWIKDLSVRPETVKLPKEQDRNFLMLSQGINCWM